MTTHTPPTAGLTDKPLYRIPEVIELLPLSRSKIYELIRSGRLRSVKEGSSRLVTKSALADYVALLEQEAEVA